MIYLNKKEILDLVSMEEIVETIEEAFFIYESKNFHLPDRISEQYLNKTLLYMPCFIEGLFGTKILTVFPENKKINHPVIDGLMLLNDYETGKPIAMMDGKAMTSLRTGAVGAAGIKHLTPADASSIGVVGAGVQGYNQAVFACKIRNINRITVFDTYAQNLESFVGKLREETGVEEISIAESIEALVGKSEIIITTTTSNEPVLPDDPELLKGRHFIGIGSYKPTMKEYPDSIYGLVDKVYIDTEFGKEETGDLCRPLEEGKLSEDRVETFGSYLTNEKNKADIVSRTTFFKSVGMALFDVMVAKLFYEKAVEKGAGQKIDL